MTEERERALLVGLKLALSIGVLLAGFEGVSDDDYSRTTIAQAFAESPRLNPSSSSTAGEGSWLPLPFWLTGGVMMLAGRSLLVARLVAIALGIASVFLVRQAALWVTDDRQVGLVAGVLAAILPWSVRLGVSPIPELPTAALCVLAIASLPLGVPQGMRDDSTPRRRLLGAVALLAACLSRYEAWFVAVGFVGVLVVEAARERYVRPSTGLTIALAIAGPLVWSVWNAIEYGDPLRYFHHVASYKQAIDHAGPAARAFEYLRALLRAEPELLLLVAYGLYRWRATPALHQISFERYRRPALALGCMYVLLTLANLRGGAPTHHIERALLPIHLFGAILAADLLVGAKKAATLGSRKLIAVSVLATIPILIVLRSWVLYRESFAHRRNEVALGEDIAKLVPEDERVLIEVIDFGYFAVEAGSERPWSFVTSTSFDPAAGPKEGSFEELLVMADQQAIRYVVAMRYSMPPDVEKLTCRNLFCLYERKPH